MKYLPFALCALFNPVIAFASDFERGYTAKATGVILLYLIFCGWIIWRHRKKTALNRQADQADSSLRNSHSILVAYASQTGNAELIARKTAESLKTTALSLETLPLSAIDATTLQDFSRILFVVSTTGEGDAPDNAADFQQNLMQSNINLSHLQYGILALGDSSYTFFCGFGHALDAWLQSTHALPLFDLVAVDHLDDGALRHWQYQLGLLAHNTEMPDWETPVYQPWTLVARSQLNQGSAGAPVFHLKLASQKKNMQWQAGDIAEIGPRNSQQAVTQFLTRLALDSTLAVSAGATTLADALLEKLLPHDEASWKALSGLDAEAILRTLKNLPHREYSIASIPQDQHLELLIRQTHYADGRPGIGSGWLTQHAAVGGDIALRIRENTAFHLPTHNIPLILIGNGTGIAGLRAHLKARITSGHLQNMLIFGERNAGHDFYFKDELHTWLEQGSLTKLATAFSRDQAEKTYVQDVVRSLAGEIKNWVQNGAAIYVCGSATGMAPAVHNQLLEILGELTVANLTASGRYRRDVY
ncbi:sulfite reductase subunit alpha [Methylophilus flavus]|uniref:NADPH--hemoprotein reductase n=1 Tax=Methylophilus flavus TaxID=640084 RepID=A0ABW3PFD1_9PROT